MGTRANTISNTALTAKWTGADRWLSDGGSRGAGRLVAKLSQAGVTFYFAYFDTENRRRFVPIGPYDSTGKRGMTLQRARDRAAELSGLYRTSARDLHLHIEAKQAAEAAAHRQAKEEARRAEIEAKRGTLRQLLDGYIGHLERAGKQSAADARRIFKKHVYEAAPHVADQRAASIHVDEFVAMLGKLTEAGKGRTAGKLRSYLRAAFSLALRARTDPSAPLTLRTFGIEANPIASIGALSQFNRTRDRNLSVEELRAFLTRAEAMPPSVKKDAVLLCLQLGGQRPAQMLRARPVDADLSAGTLTLYDTKGSRKQPRVHVLPLTRKASAIVRRRLDSADEAPYLFTNDGKTALRAETISVSVSEIAAEMLEAKEARAPFELRDLRRTCETMLAAIGIPKDIRAQLQSHGLGGVQSRHYDRHEYMLEKRAALAKWQRHLDRIHVGKTGKVVQGRFGKAAAK